MSEPTKPVYLAAATGGRIKVSKTLATGSDLARMRDWFADAAHSLINNTFRYCGLECEGSTSEMTWDIAREVSDDVMAMVAARVAVEKERLAITSKAAIKTKQEQLAEALATVERLRKELGVEQPA